MLEKIINKTKFLTIPIFLSLPFYYGCSKKSEEVKKVEQIQQKTVNETDLDKLLTKLPDGTIKIEYEKIVEKPYIYCRKYEDIALDSSSFTDFWGTFVWLDNKDVKLYTSDMSSSQVMFYETATISNFDTGEIISKSEIKLTPSINPNDNVAEAFIIPQTKTGKLSFIIFLDEKCLNKFKEPTVVRIGVMGWSKYSLHYLKKLNSEKQHDIYIESVITESDIDIRPRPYFYLGNFEKEKERFTNGSILTEEERYNILKDKELIHFKIFH